MRRDWGTGTQGNNSVRTTGEAICTPRREASEAANLLTSPSMLLAFRSVRKFISVVLSLPVCSTLLQRYQPTNTRGNWLFILGNQIPWRQRLLVRAATVWKAFVRPGRTTSLLPSPLDRQTLFSVLGTRGESHGLSLNRELLKMGTQKYSEQCHCQGPSSWTSRRLVWRRRSSGDSGKSFSSLRPTEVSVRRTGSHPQRQTMTAAGLDALTKVSQCCARACPQL